MKLLIDECLHTSLVERAHAAGHAAEHVTRLGLGGRKDRELMAIVLDRDYTFVTNNRSDFLSLYGKAQLHAGLVVVIPNVSPDRQRTLFDAVLNHIGQREPINTVLEVEYRGTEILCTEYSFP